MAEVLAGAFVKMIALDLFGIFWVALLFSGKEIPYQALSLWKPSLFAFVIGLWLSAT